MVTVLKPFDRYRTYFGYPGTCPLASPFFRFDFLHWLTDLSTDSTSSIRGSGGDHTRLWAVY